MEGRPQVFRDGVFSSLQSPTTYGSQGNFLHVSQHHGVENGAPIFSSSSMNAQASLSPISSFAELSIGTFRMVAPSTEEIDDSGSSDSALSSSFKVIVNSSEGSRSRKRSIWSGKRVEGEEHNRCHSDNTDGLSFDFKPSDWFLKRRKIRIKRWER